MMVQNFGEFLDRCWSIDVEVEDVSQSDFKRILRIRLKVTNKIDQLYGEAVRTTSISTRTTTPYLEANMDR